MSATIGSVCVCAAPVVWREWVRIKRAAWFLVTISTEHRRRCNRRTHGDTHQHMDADITEKRRVWFINLPLVVFITDSVCVSVCVKCAHLYVIVNELKEEVWPGSVWEESDTLWPSATYFSLAVLRLHLFHSAWCHFSFAFALFQASSFLFNSPCFLSSSAVPLRIFYSHWDSTWPNSIPSAGSQSKEVPGAYKSCQQTHKEFAGEMLVVWLLFPLGGEKFSKHFSPSTTKRLIQILEILKILALLSWKVKTKKQSFCLCFINLKGKSHV